MLDVSCIVTSLVIGALPGAVGSLWLLRYERQRVRHWQAIEAEQMRAWMAREQEQGQRWRAYWTALSEYPDEEDPPPMPNTPTPGPREEDDAEHCALCGCRLEPEACWSCLGEGAFHNCGEDTCACLDPDELHDVCEECQGEGHALVCPNARHHPRQEDTPYA